MEIQSLYDILYIFLNWHLARIATFANLVFGVMKAKTLKLKELAIRGLIGAIGGGIILAIKGASILEVIGRAASNGFFGCCCWRNL